MMIYKGGPKNYSKRDWQILSGIAIASIAAAAVAVSISPHSAVDTTASARSDLPSSEPVSAANPGPVDAFGLNREQEAEQFTQRGREAGLDESTAQRVGKEAADLCNGNPDCLR